jgi:hypothetical protein
MSVEILKIEISKAKIGFGKPVAKLKSLEELEFFKKYISEVYQKEVVKTSWEEELFVTLSYIEKPDTTIKQA